MPEGDFERYYNPELSGEERRRSLARLVFWIDVTALVVGLALCAAGYGLGVSGLATAGLWAIGVSAVLMIVLGIIGAGGV